MSESAGRAIPPLDGRCNSWILTDKRDGKVIGEFYKRSSVEKFNPDVVLIETAADYLARFNMKVSALTEKSEETR
jgi:hypothetical protein